MLTVLAGSSSGTDALSNKTVSCREVAGSTKAPQDFISLIEDNWNVILMKLAQSSAWRGQEDSMRYMDESIMELKNENDELRKRLKITEGRLTRAEKRLDDANEKILDLTTRSMRDNLIFKNVEEKQNESEKDIEDKLKGICKERLKLTDDDMGMVHIERAHRVGKPGRPGDKRARNIVAKLSSKGKSVILAHLKNLSRGGNNDIKIQEQYPPEMHSRRNKLWPLFLEAKQSGHNVKYQVGKLLVGNKLVNPPRDKVKDINLDTSCKSLVLKAKETPFVTTDRSHFQGHIYR